MDFWFYYLLVFVAGFIDSIAGGGGLITVPTIALIVGPGAIAIGTNKIVGLLRRRPRSWLCSQRTIPFKARLSFCACGFRRQLLREPSRHFYSSGLFQMDDACDLPHYLGDGIKKGFALIGVTPAHRICCELLDGARRRARVRILRRHSRTWRRNHHAYCAACLRPDATLARDWDFKIREPPRSRPPLEVTLCTTK